MVTKLRLNIVLIKDEIQRSQEGLNTIREALRIQSNNCKVLVNRVYTKVNKNDK